MPVSVGTAARGALRAPAGSFTHTAIHWRWELNGISATRWHLWRREGGIHRGFGGRHHQGRFGGIPHHLPGTPAIPAAQQFGVTGQHSRLEQQIARRPGHNRAVPLGVAADRLP